METHLPANVAALSKRRTRAAQQRGDNFGEKQKQRYTERGQARRDLFVPPSVKFWLGFLFADMTLYKHVRPVKNTTQCPTVVFTAHACSRNKMRPSRSELAGRVAMKEDTLHIARLKNLVDIVPGALLPP